MAAGIDAVKTQLKREFSQTEITENLDFDTKDVVLTLDIAGLDYKVRVTQEYDEDYASGQTYRDLSMLGTILQASQGGRVTVTCSGIISK